MRISFKGKEHQISGLSNGFNLYGTPIAVIVEGVPVAMNGKKCKGVRDISVYKTDEEGNRVEVIPEPVEEMRPDESWYKVDIKIWLDAQGIEYPSGANKSELLGLV